MNCWDLHHPRKSDILVSTRIIVPISRYDLNTESWTQTAAGVILENSPSLKDKDAKNLHTHHPHFGSWASCSPPPA
jgi:hypothetical protein